MSAKTLLMGGSPTSGKTFLAEKLARELGYPWLSTDVVRAQMLKLVRREDYPGLFFFEDNSGAEALRYLGSKTPQEIVQDQNAESAEVWRGVQAIIDETRGWQPFVIEGVAILPEMVARLERDKDLRACFLINTHPEQIREVVFRRGLWAEPSAYNDTIKEKEVEWVLVFNDFIRAEVAKYGYPVVEIDASAGISENITLLRCALAL